VPDLYIIPPALSNLTNVTPPAEDDEGVTQEHRFGLTPNKAPAIPMHLRTSSTQVEPATPPKWMTEQDARERIKKAEEEEVAKDKAQAANEQKRSSVGKADLAVIKKGNKRDRPTGEWIRAASTFKLMSSLACAQAVWSGEGQDTRSNQYS
jgi:hypothetical protein